MTGVRGTLTFTCRTSFGASRVADFASKEHTRPSITANRKLKNQNRILRLKATEAAACISRKEVTVHTIQHKQLPDKSPVFRLFISFPWIHIIPIIYVISMNSYYTNYHLNTNRKYLGIICSIIKICTWWKILHSEFTRMHERLMHNSI